MRADTVALGVFIVTIGAVGLYVARNVFPRFDIPEAYRDLLRLTVAVLAGGMITFGFVIVVLGLLGLG